MTSSSLSPRALSYRSAPPQPRPASSHCPSAFQGDASAFHRETQRFSPTPAPIRISILRRDAQCVSAGAKSLIEAVELSGSAGVKLQQQMAFARKRQGSGDEGRGALWAGSLRGTDRGSEPAGSGAAVWDRPADSIQDAGVLGSAGLPA